MDDDQPKAAPASVPEPASSPSGTGLWSRFRRLFGAPPRDASLRDSLEGVIEQHAAGNGADTVRPDARSMMHNLIAFSGMRVEDVMVPRADIIAVDEQMSVRELLARFLEGEHSRLPVYRETLDEPLGMVHIKDLVKWLNGRAALTGAEAAESGAKRRKEMALGARELNATVGSLGIMRPLLFVPPSMPAGDLLVKMQTNHIHMAIVVDEYGGTDGLATIEDLVEEIVGDIADEHDDEDQFIIRKLSEGLYAADGRTPIDEVERLLGIDLLPDEREEDADTLGGLIFSMLGRVPVRGELVLHDAGIEFEIAEADPRRVRKLKIHTRPRPARKQPAPPAAA